MAETYPVTSGRGLVARETHHGDWRDHAVRVASDIEACVHGPADGLFIEGAVDTEDGSCPSRKITLDVTCTAAEPVSAALRVAMTVPAGGEPHWLIPGLFYGENRPAECRKIYPRFDPSASDDPFTSPMWSFRADRAATPVVFGWTGAGGAALAATETGPLGLAGLGFALTGEGPELRLHFPYREEPVSYDGSDSPKPPLHPRHLLEPGERVRVEFRAYSLCPDQHGYAPVLRDLHARTPADPGQVPWVSPEEAAALAAEGLYRWHYRHRDGVLVETAGFDRELTRSVGGRADRPAMHVAWISGAPYAYALLFHGRHREDGPGGQYASAAVRVLDTIAAHRAPCGTFWGQWTESGGWGSGWTPGPDRLHARTLADASLFMLRAAALERRLGRARPHWETAVRANLDVAYAAQREDGHPGSAYHAVTGEPLSYQGAAGLAWIAPLAEAAETLGRPSYLEAARRAGHRFAAFVEAEFLHGAPEDVDLAPTSEDGYGAVMAYVTLYEHDGDPQWLDLARRAADWMLTFRYTYDVSFSERTILGHYGFRTRGADQASPANQHLHAFGLICLPEMTRLARYTADPHYLVRTRENLACFRQFIAREDGDFGAQRGMAAERYYQTTCFAAKGMLGALSHAWSVGVLLYACEAVAGLPELASDPGSPGV